MIIISKQRLNKLLSSHSHSRNEYNIITYQLDALEVTVKLESTACSHAELSTPAAAAISTKTLLKSPTSSLHALLFAYLYIIEDYAFAGVKRLQEALGMKPVGNFKH